MPWILDQRDGRHNSLRKDERADPHVHLTDKRIHVSDFELVFILRNGMLTSDTPKVSHLAKVRGNMGKSTARMPRKVMTSM